MTNFTQEQLKAARSAKSPEELIGMAKEAGVELTREQAECLMKAVSGELADEQLKNVTGGGPDTEESGIPASEYEVWRERALHIRRYTVYIPCPCPYCKAVSYGHFSMYAQLFNPEKDRYQHVFCGSCWKDIDTIYSDGSRYGNGQN